MVLTVDVAPDLVHGDVDEGYGAVADAFRALTRPAAPPSGGTKDLVLRYALNRSGFRLWDDPREPALRNAPYVDVLGERPQLPD
jgi:hypothetical protein